MLYLECFQKYVLPYLHDIFFFIKGNLIKTIYLPLLALTLYHQIVTNPLKVLLIINYYYKNKKI